MVLFVSLLNNTSLQVSSWKKLLLKIKTISSKASIFEKYILATFSFLISRENFFLNNVNDYIESLYCALSKSA